MTVILPKLLTADEFWDFCGLPEHYGRRLELDRGEVIEMSPAGGRHGIVCFLVAHLLGVYVFARGRGRVVTNDTGVVVAYDPDSVLGPDIALYADESHFAEVPIKFERRTPTLVVEVLSPNDRLGEVMERVRKFLDMGVLIVWIVDPEARNVTVYQAGASPAVYDDTTELTGGAVLPDLRIRVAELFSLPGDLNAV